MPEWFSDMVLSFQQHGALIACLWRTTRTRVAGLVPTRACTAAWVIGAGLAASSCGGPTDAVLISSLEIVSGNGQIAAPGVVLPQPIVLRVTASNGAGIPGHTVTFQVTAGGGTVSPVSAVSDARGRVSVRWTIGLNPGNPNEMTAQVTGASASGFPIEARLVAGGDRPTVTVVSGGGQISTVGSHLPQPIVLRLTTSTGAPLANYTFTLRSLTCFTTGGCNGIPAADDQLTNPTLTTGADGTATFTGWTLGTTVNFKCLGLYPGTSGPQNLSDIGLGQFFCALAEPGPPARLVKRSQDNQQAPAGTTLLSIGVTVEDQFGNAVGCWGTTSVCGDPNAPEVQVTFAPSAGGSVAQSQATTDRGTAGTDWTIAAGANTLTITVGSLFVTYTATGT
jgi:hypothetical protein